MQHARTSADGSKCMCESLLPLKFPVIQFIILFCAFVFLVHRPEITVEVESYLYSTVLVNVAIGWTQENGAFYIVSSIELPATVTKMNNTIVKIEVLCNTVYQMNVEAYSADCGSTLTVITLSYSEHDISFMLIKFAQ